MSNISVCMATYNGAKYIQAQLESILKQLDEDDEVIVSDDSSTDETIDVIKSFNDARIRVFENQKFSNHLLNFENALKHASKEYIFLSDQDDIWVEGKVKAVMELLREYDLVNTDHSLIDEQGATLIESYFNLVDSRPGLVKNFIKCSYFGCCMAFRRKVFEKATPFPKDVSSHDVWLGFVADIYFKVKFLDFPFTQYRKHENNFSTATNPKSTKTLFEKFKLRYNIIKNAPSLFFRNI